MSEYSYFDDKTTVVLHEDDRKVVEQLKLADDEPVYKTLHRALNTQRTIHEELERVRSGNDSEPEVDGRAE